MVKITFSANDLTELDKRYYKEFSYEVPGTGFETMQDYIAFCRNVAMLFTFAEETFDAGLAEYLDSVGFYEDGEVNISSCKCMEEKIKNDVDYKVLAEKVVNEFFNQKIKKDTFLNKNKEEKYCDDKNSSCLDE